MEITTDEQIAGATDAGESDAGAPEAGERPAYDAGDARQVGRREKASRCWPT